MLSKFYVLVAAIPGFLCFIPFKKVPIVLKFVLIHLFCLMAVYLFGRVTGYDFVAILERKQHDFVAYVQSLNAVGSYIAIPDLEPTLWSIVKHSPRAFFNTFFRPTIFESNNPMMLMAAFENLLILGGLSLAFISFKPKNLKENYMQFSFSFVVILFVLSGLTTPVLGALVRYKAPALPFLGIMFLSVINFQKVDQWMAQIGLKKKK
jgi:hypothetical protein